MVLVHGGEMAATLSQEQNGCFGLAISVSAWGGSEGLMAPQATQRTALHHLAAVVPWSPERGWIRTPGRGVSVARCGWYCLSFVICQNELAPVSETFPNPFLSLQERETLGPSGIFPSPLPRFA